MIRPSPTAALIDKALSARRESRQIEFKATFDPTVGAEWCEITKDIVAIANSGGGIIVFGLSSNGSPTGANVDAINAIDPADLSNKITKYTGLGDFEVEVHELQKEGNSLTAFVIPEASMPLVFERPGAYEVGGKQKTAFAQGTIYFRHGSKSEPGIRNDIRHVIDRQLERIRKSWVRNVRKVVEAPPGSRISIQPTHDLAHSIQAVNVRVAETGEAIPITLTRDKGKATGTLMHEQVSPYIFDEINNVVDANTALAKGQRRFFLGQPVYYRVYAEREHVELNAEQFALLSHGAVSDFYAPSLFWAISSNPSLIADCIADLYLAPKSPQVHWMIRVAMLLGKQFCDWLSDRWNRKWGHFSQPPTFYFTFLDMCKKSLHTDRDRVLAAARSAGSVRLSVPGYDEVSCADLLGDPKRAENLLSASCMSVFEGNPDLRSTARTLDYIAYGTRVVRAADAITEAAIQSIGDAPPGDLKE